MSRKNYRQVADVINKQLLDAIDYGRSTTVIASVARDLAYAFKCDNSNFQYDVFYAACGLNERGY